MFKKVYRAVLVMSFIIICALIFASARDYIDKTNASTPAIYETPVEKSIKTPTESSVKMVIPCGDPIGIYVKSKGVMVIATGSIKDTAGNKVSPCEGLLKTGDYIISLDGFEIEGKKQLIEYVKNSKGKKIKVTLRRGEEILDVDVTPALTGGGLMLGVWVKDDISGIGTITFVDENGFVALGHSINDNDTGFLFEVSDGAIYKTKLLNVVKPTASTPGKLEGMIDYTSGNILGRVESNSKAGIKGYLTRYGADLSKDMEWMPVADDCEIHLGKAYLVSGISGERKYYEIEISDIDISDENCKNMKFVVVDRELLRIAGGIVQGMSGTPIIQDGKVIGAVTHVFVNDSTKGYGICISRMIEE